MKVFRFEDEKSWEWIQYKFDVCSSSRTNLVPVITWSTVEQNGGKKIIQLPFLNYFGFLYHSHDGNSTNNTRNIFYHLYFLALQLYIHCKSRQYKVNIYISIQLEKVSMSGKFILEVRRKMEQTRIVWLLQFHQFPSSIFIPSKVYPFNANGRLYPKGWIAFDVSKSIWGTLCPKSFGIKSIERQKRHDTVRIVCPLDSC